GMEEKAGFETPARIGEELGELRKEVREGLNQTNRLVSAMKDLLNFVIADRIAEWPLEVRMGVVQRIANLSAVDIGVLHRDRTPYHQANLLRKKPPISNSSQNW
ncbi:hypothetical protein M1N58_02460, partial [Dehalococcoidales bacterium]|nr:hypothetical protein [Dehalococcoidales bacterium]